MPFWGEYFDSTAEKEARVQRQMTRDAMKGKPHREYTASNIVIPYNVSGAQASAYARRLQHSIEKGKSVVVRKTVKNKAGNVHQAKGLLIRADLNQLSKHS